MSYRKLVTQKIKVLKAIQDGCNITREIADEVGLPVATCSMFVAQLKREGVVRHTGRRIPRDPDSRLHGCKVIELVEDGV